MNFVCVYDKQGCLFVNNSDQTLSWTLHTKAAGPLLEDGTFKFLHRTGSPFTPSSAGKKSVIPDITLDSGETFQLGVLFTPRKGIFYYFFLKELRHDILNNFFFLDVANSFK